MASSDQLMISQSDVKIEIDIAEEPERPWGSLQNSSGANRDWCEKSVNSTITPCETDCTNPSAAAMISEPGSQSSSGNGINIEFVDIGTDDTFQPVNQPAIVPDIKSEPFDDSMIDDVFPMFQSTAKSEVVAAGIRNNTQSETVTTCISEAICNRDEEKNRPEDVKQSDGSCIRTTSQPSSTDRTHLHMSANTSGSLLPLNTNHVCQHCSAVFVLLSSWKQHMAFVHGEKLQAAFPETSAPEGCDVGHCGNMDSEKEGDILGDRKSEEKKNDRTDDNQTEKTCMEKQRPHVCDMCSKAFTKTDHLNRHKLIHTGQKLFVCDVCSKPFTQAGSLKTHKLIHTGQKQFVCDVCNKAFTQAGSLKTHKLIHIGLKQFVCDVCSKAFTLAGHLNRHKLIHTGQKQFVCDECSKAFTQAGSLTRHKLIHTGLKQFECDVCSKAFNEAGNLKSHKLIHTGLKKFVCDVCNKAFTQAGNLKSHKLIHTGQKQFVCDVCSKAFTLADHLHRHKLIHIGLKQFVCDVCSKAFTQAGHLKTHKLIHNEQKQFVCDVCSRAFTEGGSLKRHKLLHTGQKRLECDVCSKVFTEVCHLNRHKLIHTCHSPVYDVYRKPGTDVKLEETQVEYLS